MIIRSWAGGLMLFALFYAIIIVVMFVSQWPSMHEPNHNVTLKSNLPAESQTLIYRIEKSKNHGVKGDALYKIETGHYPMNDTEPVVYLDAAHMINGHILVFQPDSGPTKVVEIAKQYADVLREHQIQETANAIVRLIMTLFIPIFTIGLFAWAGNKLWNAIQDLD
ncbi:MAG: hypothetical protein ABGY96_28625 [bacterium]|nr:hypothetical protein [Gammaproteobacteria bacterium]HIL96636.1 hypothetical protein [Pseudomonadales bacterium]